MGLQPVIIAADEDKDIRFLIKVYLRDYKLEVCEARSGGELIEAAGKREPAAAVINYVLGDMTGYRAAEEIHKSYSGLPVIIMTLEGFDLYEDRPGVNEYLVKPFSRAQFREARSKDRQLRSICNSFVRVPHW